mgnify:CR=1 FL=1
MPPVGRWGVGPGWEEPWWGEGGDGPGCKTQATPPAPAARAGLPGLGRQALHAYTLAIEHPTTSRLLEFRSELPADLARLRRELTAG